MLMHKIPQEKSIFEKFKSEQDLVYYYIVSNIIKYCNERNLSINRLALLSCLTQSTLESIINGTTKNPKFITIVKICDGLNISLKDFFDIIE